MTSRIVPVAVLIFAAASGVGQSPPPLALQKELSIGTADGPPEYAFGRVGPMAVRRGGGFYLFDASDNQIRRYDTDGKFLGLVGRSGAGPGEYRSVLGMDVHGDSLLVVFDPGNGRISLFDSVGAYRRSIPFQRGSFFGDKAFAIDQAGLLYVRALRIVATAETRSMPTQFIRLRLDGSVVDSLPLPIESSEGNPFVLITSDGARWSFPVREVFNVLPSGGIITGNSGTYRLTATPISGAPVIIDSKSERIPLSGAEYDEWSAWATYMANRGQPSGSGVKVERPGAAIIPKIKPVFRDFFGDPSGRIWVNLYTVAVKRDIPPRPASDPRPLLTIREPNVYEVFDATGRPLGRMTLPPASLLLAVNGNRIWVRTEAPGGEYILTRYLVPALK